MFLEEALGSEFSADDPQAFYLWERREEMEAMADACLIVKGTRLPVHCQVLSLSSGVFCRMFADMRSVPGGTPPCKRKADDGEQELTIEGVFEGFSVWEVALFLRFLYDPRWQGATWSNLSEELKDNLPALLRLAHRLEAQRLLDALCKRMADPWPASTPQLIEWLKAADMCQLDRVQSVCLMRLAERTIGWGSSLPHAIGHASLLKGCNTRILTQLIGIITAAGAHPRSARQQLSMMMPTAEAVRVALAKTANPVRFDYVLEAFAQLPSDVGAVQTSPEFTAAGHRWTLCVYPGGDSAGAQGYVSVYVRCVDGGANMRASCVVEALTDDGVAGRKRTLHNKPVNSGWSKFTRSGDLAQRGLLPGGSLRLRVTLTLEP